MNISKFKIELNCQMSNYLSLTRSFQIIIIQGLKKKTQAMLLL